MLSACETGVGKAYFGEGVRSIASGFQLAGVDNVLFSQWKVNDETTAVLMERFYHHLKKGNSYSFALHAAQLDFLENSKIDPLKKSPYYWAPFVYYGAQQEERSGGHIFLWWTLGVLLAVFLLWSIKRIL